MKRKNKRTPPPSLAGASSSRKPVTSPSVPASVPRRRRWLFRLLAMTFVPLLFLGALELSLRLASYGYNPDYFLPLRIGDEEFLVQNEDFSRRFFPGDVSRQPSAIRMKAHKPLGAIRIFVLGESAAMGDPEPAFGPARYLEVLLRERYPEQEFEIVNVAFTAINSHVILPIARECAKHDGDVWIVYMGNNEMVGPFGAATVFGLQSPPLRYVRWTLALQRTRLGQLARSLAQRLQSPATPAPSWQGMQMFTENRVAPDSLKRQAARQNFEGNLRDILDAGQKSGARILLNTVAVNLRESPPFASWPDEQLSSLDRTRFDSLLAQGQHELAASNWVGAGAFFRQAVELDATHAAAHFDLAQCFDHTGDATGAMKHYQLACDLDALPFRTDSPLNNAIRQSAVGRGGNLRSLEAAEALTRHGGGTPPGNESFYEHVHFNFAGAYRLGLAWAEAVASLVPAGPPGQPATDWANEQRCDDLLGLTDWNRKLVIESMVRRLQQPPLNSQANSTGRLNQLREREQSLLAGMSPAAVAQANQLYAGIIAAHPEDHFLRESFANFLQLTGDLPGAIREWRVVSGLLPQDFLPWFQVGVLQSRSGQHNEAQQNIRRALTVRPILVEGWLELGRSLAAQQKWAAAADAFGRACELRPNDPMLWANRAGVAAQLGRRAEAIEWYRCALVMRPEYWEARVALADQLAQGGQINEAIAEYEAVLQIKPDYALAHLNIGVMLAKQGRLDAAAVKFQETLRLEPENRTAADYLLRAQSRHNP